MTREIRERGTINTAFLLANHHTPQYHAMASKDKAFFFFSRFGEINTRWGGIFSRSSVRVRTNLVVVVVVTVVACNTVLLWCGWGVTFGGATAAR